jgi:SAM-dependent methyltransferase
VIGWDHPATAERYERYYRRHARYRTANEVLVREAALVPGLRVLDMGAGTGRTAAAALPALGPDGSVVCVEPAAAMRAIGMWRLEDPRVEWRSGLAPADERYDRILCGASLWLLEPLGDWFHRFADLLRPGGALCFDIPALYLGEPDEPGGGRDPLLLDLPVRLAEVGERGESAGVAPAPDVPATSWNHTAPDVEATLRSAGLAPHSWTFRIRLTQTSYARWLTIPVLTNRLFPEAAASERDQRIERALATVDRRSFKWERWRGWTAWKR